MLTGLKVPELDPNEDEDKDGIINKDEEKLGTNPYQKDTDVDGLDDYAEIYIYGTDPLNPDTDGDGINDGYEVFLGINVLRSNDKQDTYTKELLFDEHQVAINITAAVEPLVNTQVEKVTDEYLPNTDVILGNIIDINTIGSIVEATLTFTYDIDELNQKGLDENSLSIYYLDEENLELIKLDSNIDLEAKIVSTEINHFGKYVLADSIKINDISNELEIFFQIDSTKSMLENDPDSRSISIIDDLVTSLKGNHRFGVGEINNINGAEFGAISSFPSRDREYFYDCLDLMRKNPSHSGSDIAALIAGPLGMFVTNVFERIERKYLILFTDGIHNHSGKLDIDSQIERAKNMGVKIYTIGFGDNVNEKLLQKIANETSGQYFHSDNVEELKKILLEDERVSLVPPTISKQKIEYDGKTKEVELIAKNGFNMDQHGFKFGNFVTKESAETNGTCYGMAATSYLMYLRKMPQIGNKIEDIDLNYDLSMVGNFDVKTLNISELHTDSVIAFNEMQGFYEEKPGSYDNKETNIHMLNNQGKEYYENTGMEVDNWHYNKNESTLYQVPTPVSKNISVEELTPYGDFTKQDINSIKSLVWWWDSQSRINQKRDIINLDSIFEKEDFNTIKKNGLLGFYLKNGGGHAVVAQALYKSLDERNTYYLEIYDNNFPNSVQYLKIQLKNKWFDPFGLFTPTIEGQSLMYGEISTIEFHDIETLLGEFIANNHVQLY